MKEGDHNWIFAACGIGYVVLDLLGVLLATIAGKTHNLTVGSTPGQIAHAIATPAPAGVWVGAYMEMVGMALFVAFAAWAAVRLGGGLLGSVVRGAAFANVGASVVALAVGDTVAYRAGHGLGLATATALITLSEAIYVGTWFLTAVFLVAAGALALASARRALGWSAIGIAGYTLVGAAASFDNVGQFSVLLAMVWTVAASITLARQRREPARILADARA
jgi:hypothetical protein